MSATAVHFSILSTRTVKLGLETISDTMSRQVSLKRSVMREMFGASFFFSSFIQAWPRNSSLLMEKRILWSK